jgi:hypothetical protein
MRKLRVRREKDVASWFKVVIKRRKKMREVVRYIDGLQAARSRIRELEAALADARMDYCLESAFLDIACGKLGTGAEELKKKRTLQRLPDGERQGGWDENAGYGGAAVPQAGDGSAKLLQGTAETAIAGGGQGTDRASGSGGAGGTAAAWRQETVSYFGTGTGEGRGNGGAGPVF